MAASDHLSGPQFMHVSDVGKLKSANDWGMTMEQSYAARHNPASPRQRAITESMAAEGWHPDKPLVVANGDTGHDGHHRYYAARDTGISQIPVHHTIFTVGESAPRQDRSHELPGLEDALRRMF